MDYCSLAEEPQLVCKPCHWWPHLPASSLLCILPSLLFLSAFNVDKPEDIGPAVEPPAAEQVAIDSEPGSDSGG